MGKNRISRISLLTNHTAEERKREVERRKQKEREKERERERERYVALTESHTWYTPSLEISRVSLVDVRKREREREGERERERER